MTDTTTTPTVAEMTDAAYAFIDAIHATVQAGGGTASATYSVTVDTTMGMCSTVAHSAVRARAYIADVIREKTTARHYRARITGIRVQPQFTAFRTGRVRITEP